MNIESKQDLLSTVLSQWHDSFIELDCIVDRIIKEAKILLISVLGANMTQVFRFPSQIVALKPRISARPLGFSCKDAYIDMILWFIRSQNSNAV